MDIINLLANDSFIIYNKSFAKKYGVEEAILLGAMCSYQKGFKNEEFYREQEKMLDDTALTLYALRKAMKNLQNLGIVEIRKKGLPAKHFYKVNVENLEKCFNSSDNEINSTRGIENDRSSDFENDSTINNNNPYKNKDNNNDNKKERKKSANYDEIIETQIKSAEVKEALKGFIQMRLMIKKPPTDRALNMIVKKLYELAKTEEEAIKILDQSTSHCWLDIYALKQDNKKDNKNSWGKDLIDDENSWTEDLMAFNERAQEYLKDID